MYQVTPRAVMAFATLLAFASPAFAGGATNLVTNGDFEQTSATSSTQIYNGNLTGWTSANRSDGSYPGFSFIVVAPGTADGTNATVYNSTAGVEMYGPDVATTAANYSANGLTASPTGGNFIEADADPSVSGAISQSISGLTVGGQYTLSFYWASGQLYASQNSGVATTESWQVGFGNQTQSTATNTTAYKGFDAWTKVTMTFTATSATQTLSFLAVGGPSGNPPTALLDGVSLVAAAVPEPATWILLFAGLLGFGTLRTLRRRNDRVA